MILGGVLFVFLLFYQLNGLFFQRNRAQLQSDELAVSCAAAMNQGDRIAQVNELKASSRELVYLSRQREQLADTQEFRALQPLCTQLVNEAREGATLVEAERKNQIRVICSEIQSNAWRHNRRLEDERGFAIAWLKTTAPSITCIEVGRIENVESNVRQPTGVAELANYDIESGLIQPGSNLLKANKNARLPGIDSDLNFHITSLPALVKGTRAPARNVNARKFVPQALIFDGGAPIKFAADQIPSAIRITSTMNATLGDRAEHTERVRFVSTGTTTGAIAGGRSK